MTKLILLRIQLLLILNLLAVEAYCQESNSATQTAIEKKQYVFLAQSVTPMKGGTRQLNPGYTLTIKGDTIICDLPYFGQVYQPSFGATDGGLTFTSTQFDYQTKVRKKGGWDIKIKTKDLKSQQLMNLTIFQNGTASLSVTSNDRQSINFNGSIKFVQE